MFRQFCRITTFLLMLCILLPGTVDVGAQDDTSEPVVFGVLFYSPTCPHCHDVIDNDAPLWQEEFGESFILLFIDASQEGGSFLFSATCSALEIESCGGVPMMVIGEEVMVGSVQIPERVPGIIREGLATGGIGLPPVPELQESYATYIAAQEATPEVEVTAEPEATPQNGAAENSTGAVGLGDAPSLDAETWIDKLNNDPEGNSIAVATLLGLVISLGLGLWFGPKGILVEGDLMSTIAITAITIAAILMATTLVAESSGDTLAAVTSWGILALLLMSVIRMGVSRSAAFLTPLVALAGLLAAFYLAQVEVSGAEATCGLIGDCNTVQQSEYAELFGVLPIGVLGVIGYIAILLVWTMSYVWNENTIYTSYAQAGLLGMSLFGMIFSIYLTFLEPFVIGATCIWCITSSLLMMLLLWLVSPSGWQALQEIRKPSEKTESVPLRD